MVLVLAHGGVSSPHEEMLTGLLLVLLVLSTVGGTLVGALTRHGRKPAVPPRQPERESLQNSWSGVSWER